MSPPKSAATSNVVAALVVLEHGPTSVQSAVASNIDALRPPHQMVESARQAFANLGFRVADLIGNSFAIEAPISHFNEVFGVELHAGRDGAIRVRGAEEKSSLELPVAALPDDVRGLVRTVTFSEPLAFGPSGFGP